MLIVRGDGPEAYRGEDVNPRAMKAKVDAAARYLAMDLAARRAKLLAVDPGPVPPRPDAHTFARDAGEALALDPASAVLLAEAWVCARLRAPRARYDVAREAAPIRLHEEREAIALQSVRSIVQTERNLPRREAILSAYADSLIRLQRPARAVVDATRDAVDALDPALRDAIAPPVDDARAFLTATDDLWRELDLRVLRAGELDPAALRWSDRTRSLVGVSLVRELPPATWTSLGTDWWERVGLGESLRGVRDALAASSQRGGGVYALVDPEAGGVTLAGRPAPSAWDAAEVVGAGSLAASASRARGAWTSHRRGVDRVTDAALHTLGRRLLHERSFLHRAAGLDSETRVRVQVEALHAELARLRWDAVMARFLREALDRAPAISARFFEAVTAALGASPPMTWAAHLVADAMEPGAPWGSRWGQRVEGARVEVALRDALRNQFNEDWHRNPRTGEWLGVALDRMRASGAVAWAERPEDLSPEAQAKRLAEDYATAR